MSPDCLSDEEKKSYWNGVAEMPKVYLVMNHKQVDMKNSTEQLQPVYVVQATPLERNLLQTIEI